MKDYRFAASTSLHILAEQPSLARASTFADMFGLTHGSTASAQQYAAIAIAMADAAGIAPEPEAGPATDDQHAGPEGAFEGLQIQVAADATATGELIDFWEPLAGFTPVGRRRCHHH